MRLLKNLKIRLYFKTVFEIGPFLKSVLLFAEKAISPDQKIPQIFSVTLPYFRILGCNNNFPFRNFEK